MDSDITNTQDLLKQMDNITGDDVKDMSMDENTQQIVQNIDQITSSQLTQNESQLTQNESQLTQNESQLTQNESQLTQIEGSVCGSQIAENDSEPTQTNTSYNQTLSHIEGITEDKHITLTQNDVSNSESLSQGVSNTQQQLLAGNELQQTGLETETKDAKEVLLKTKELSSDIQTLTDEVSSTEPQVKELRFDQTETKELSSNIQTLTDEVSSTEPPVKRTKVDQTETIRNSAFQFIPRNVSHSNSSSVARKQENKSQSSVSSCNKLADNLQTKPCSQTSVKMTDSETFEKGASSRRGISTSPAKVKSYDANVVLPEDIVKTWRTSCDTKEGEIIELDSDYDGVYNCQPVCFARTDFNQEEDNYLRGCKWSPDGTCLLTNSNDNKLRIYNIPTDNTELTCSQVVQGCDTVYDFCWYNKMSSADPDTCCFLTTCRDGPVHMWDMNTGKLKCSYRPYNHLDEMTTAHSMAFSLDGTKLYTGFNRMIRVFDVARPGRECIQRPTFVKHQGQPGIISCIAASPQGMGIYAAGSFARAIALYHEPDGKMLCMFEGQQGGVTHIAFSPDGTKLYSGGRKDPEILCWDLRKPGQILFVALRLCETNQRLYFHQDESGRHLISGSHDGTVCVWDTSRSPVKVLSESDPLLKPVMKYKAHNDCVNGICVSPRSNIIASCSGQRHYTDVGHSDESDSDSVDSDVTSIENSVKLWRFKT